MKRIIAGGVLAVLVAQPLQGNAEALKARPPCSGLRCSDTDVGTSLGGINKPAKKVRATGSVRISVRGLGDKPPSTELLRRKLLAQYITPVKRCATTQDAVLKSKTTLQFEIDSSGQMTNLTINGDNQVVVDCVTPLLAAWRLPPPKKEHAQRQFEATFATSP